MCKINCFIVLFIVACNLSAQSYYISAYNGLTVNTCSGNFYDSGGSGSNYASNENYVVTFCSTTGSPLFFDFGATSSSLNLDAGTGDTLFFYDGLTTSGALIATLTKSDDYGFSNPTVGTFSSCVTIQWKSNASAVDGGWAATIDCTEPPVCADNLPAADVFGQATSVCNLNDYCGTTSGYYGEDAPYNFGGTGGSCPHPDDDLFAGTLENNSWLKFIAGATGATFDYNVTGGASCDGVQIGIYAFNDVTNTFTLKSPCSFTDGGHEGLFSITATALTIGETYYMMIDGNSGSNCDYTIGAGTGVATVDAGPNQTFCGDEATLNAASLTGTGVWTLVSGTGVIGDVNAANTTVTGLTLGDNIFEWTSTGSLCGDEADLVTITIECLLPLSITSFTGNYVDNTVQLTWNAEPETNALYYHVERSTDGIGFSVIGTVAATDLNSNSSEYFFVDDAPPAGNIYYRLQQVDANDIPLFSNIIAVDCKTAVNYYNISAAYVDAENQLIIPGTFVTNEQIQMNVFDITGKLIASQQGIVEKGNQMVSVDISEILTTGICILTITNGTVHYSGKFYLD